MLTPVQGGIKEVHWAFYTKRPKDESDLQNHPSSEEVEDLAHLLQLMQHTLREDGRHVVLDKEKAGLWVFSLSEALDESIAQNSGVDGLESESSRSLCEKRPLTELRRYIRRICALRGTWLLLQAPTRQLHLRSKQRALPR